MPIVNANKKGRQKPSEHRINWGCGKLSGFESFYGFAAKFCRLNQLNPVQFRRFWLSLFANKYEDYQSRLEKISLLLDEPIYLVRTVFLNNYVNSQWPQFTRHEFEFCPNIISFCPLCLAEAYHACFHEHGWLKKCPIHRVNLIQHEIPYSASPKSDRYLSYLMLLLDSNCSDWHFLNGKYRQDEDITASKYFYDYLVWLKSTDTCCEDLYDILVAEIGCNNLKKFSFKLKRNNYFIILSKLGLIDKIPSDILSLFSENSLMFEQIETKQFYSDIGINFKVHLVNYLIDYLILVKNENPSFMDFLYEEIGDLRLQHSQDSCDCVWGINNRNELVNCFPGELKYLVDYRCPYEFAINELSEMWLNFSSDIPPYFQKIEFYSPYGRRFLNSGLTGELGTNLDSNMYIHQLKLTKQTTILLDTILQKIVLAHIEELRYWLLSIKSGGSPANRKRFQPNIYLVQNENVGLQLISWPADYLVSATY